MWLKLAVVSRFCVSLWVQRWKLTGSSWKACPLLSSTTSSPTCQLPLSALLTSRDATEQNCQEFWAQQEFCFPYLGSLLIKFGGDCRHNIPNLLCTRSSFWNPGIKPACSPSLLSYLLETMSTVKSQLRSIGFPTGQCVVDHNHRVIMQDPPLSCTTGQDVKQQELWCTLFTLLKMRQHWSAPCQCLFDDWCGFGGFLLSQQVNDKLNAKAWLTTDICHWLTGNSCH